MRKKVCHIVKNMSKSIVFGIPITSTSIFVCHKKYSTHIILGLVKYGENWSTQ